MPLRDISANKRRVLDATLARLIEDPQQGRIDVGATELRFAMSDLSRQARHRLIDECVELGLLRQTATTAGGGGRYAFTFNGIVLVTEPKVIAVLNAAIAVLTRHFHATKGAGPELLSWTDVKNESSGVTEDDFGLARQAVLASRLGGGGRRGLGDMTATPNANLKNVISENAR